MKKKRTSVPHELWAIYSKNALSGFLSIIDQVTFFRTIRS